MIAVFSYTQYAGDKRNNTDVATNRREIDRYLIGAVKVCSGEIEATENRRVPDDDGVRFTTSGGGIQTINVCFACVYVCLCV